MNSQVLTHGSVSMKHSRKYASSGDSVTSPVRRRPQGASPDPGREGIEVEMYVFLRVYLNSEGIEVGTLGSRRYRGGNHWFYKLFLLFRSVGGLRPGSRNTGIMIFARF